MGGVLGLVKNNEGVGQSASAHECQWRDLELARIEPLDHLFRGQHVVERVIERAQIRIDFVTHVAGQEPEPFAGLHGRARQDDAVDLAGREHRDRHGDREIGLAGTRGADTENQVVVAQRGDIVFLAGRTRRDVALGRADQHRPIVEHRRAATLFGGGVGREADRRVDLGEIDHQSPAKPFIKRVERVAGDRRGGGRPGNRHLVATRGNRNFELLFDTREVAVELAEQKRQQIVIFELDQDGRGVRFGALGWNS